MSGSTIKKRLNGALFMLLAYLVLQDFVVVAHEFTHSTTAWLLGYRSTPFTVVRGNSITMQGWDKGVPCDRLFPSTGNLAEAAIGGMPLLMHTIFVVVSLHFLRTIISGQRTLLFFALYVFSTCTCPSSRHIERVVYRSAGAAALLMIHLLKGKLDPVN